MLLRIVYACLSGLPTPELQLPLVWSALAPYFVHKVTSIQVAARNASQFFIHILDESKMQSIILSSKNVHDLVCASGKHMSALSSLKLYFTYGQLAINSKLFLKEGIFLYCLSIMFNVLSSDDEKIMAALVAKMLSFYYKEIMDEEHDDHEEHADPKNLALDAKAKTMELQHILCQLHMQAGWFVATCSIPVYQSNLKESFSFLMTMLEQRCITSHDLLLHNNTVSHDVGSMLLNSIMNLFKGK